MKHRNLDVNLDKGELLGRVMAMFEDLVAIKGLKASLLTLFDLVQGSTGPT